MSETGALPAKLSPSRLKDFMQCPKLFYYKSILRLGTPPTEATAKGTAAHYAFEHVFDFPAGERTPEAAVSFVRPAWQVMTNVVVPAETVTEGSPEWVLREAEQGFTHQHDGDSLELARKEENAAAYREIIPAGSPEEEAFLLATEAVVRSWFELENPNKFEPSGREQYVSADIGGVSFHGYIDRLDDIAGPGGRKVYLSDYKTGKKAKPRFEDDAFFQLEVYALLLKEAVGQDVSQLRLLYVKEGNEDGVLRRNVTEQTLTRVKAKLAATVKAMRAAHAADDWQPRKQVLCGWCYFQNVCPAFNPELDGIPLATDEMTA